MFLIDDVRDYLRRKWTHIAWLAVPLILVRARARRARRKGGAK
jgi:hypothetical protein